MVFRTVGDNDQELEIGENEEAVGINIINDKSGKETRIIISRVEWDKIIKVMEYMKTVK
jgi:hypothetical protein